MSARSPYILDVIVLERKKITVKVNIERFPSNEEMMDLLEDTDTDFIAEKDSKIIWVENVEHSEGEE